MSPSSNSSSHGRNVIIIGTGIYGLAAAKTYLEVNPNIQLTLIDRDDSVGGVWSKSRVHSNLVADAPVPIFDFSDLQMSKEFGIPEWAEIPGSLMHDYLERYAEKFDILRRCVFNTEVLNVERNGKGWKLRARKVGGGTGEEQSFSCDVLIVAAGIFSAPEFPDVDRSSFQGLAFHSKDLNKNSENLASEEIKTVAVVGGNKSAFEAVSASFKAGKDVHWLIREDGAGAGVLLRATLPNGMPSSRIALVRALLVMLPTIYRTSRGWWDQTILSGKTALGRKIFNWFWMTTSMKRIGDRYDKSENGRLLKPDVLNLFWSPAGLSLIQNPHVKVLDAIDKGERIHVARTTIKSMNNKTLELSNQGPLKADAVIFATGWKSTINPLFTPSLAAELGLPAPWTTISEEDKEYWKQLDESADKKVLDLYPIFANPPYKYINRDPDHSPFRLFRAMVPPKLTASGDRNIVFLGQLVNVLHTSVAEISSLWSVAYLEDLLPPIVKDEETMNKEVAFANAFMKRRYPGRRNIPLALLEVKDWIDMLMRDMGLRSDRNRMAWERSEGRGFGWFGLKGWWKEWFVPHTPAVYCGVVQEFLKGARERGEERKDK